MARSKLSEMMFWTQFVSMIDVTGLYEQRCLRTAKSASRTAFRKRSNAFSLLLLACSLDSC